MEDKELITRFEHIEKRLSAIEERLNKMDEDKKAFEAVNHIRTLRTFEKFKNDTDEQETNLMEEILDEALKDIKHKSYFR